MRILDIHSHLVPIPIHHPTFLHTHRIHIAIKTNSCSRYYQPTRRLVPLTHRRPSTSRTTSSRSSSGCFSSRQLIVTAASELDAPGLQPPRRLRHKPNLLLRILSPLHHVLALVIPPLASTELLRRLGVTIAALTVMRLGHFVAIPGLDIGGMMSEVARAFEMGFENLLPSEVPGNVFVLSITPLMSAYFALAGVAIIPEVRRHLSVLRDEGRPGREIINGYTTILFIFFAIAQAFGETTRLAPHAAGGTACTAFKLSTSLSLIAGAVICKYLVQVIDNWGLGDGTGTVIGAGVALSFLNHLKTAIPTVLTTSPPLINICGAAALCFALIACTVRVQGMEIRLPLTFFKPKRAQYQSEHPVLRDLSKGVASAEALQVQSRFPMRLSPSGTRQLLFANFWVGLLNEWPLSILHLGPIVDNAWGFAAMVFLLESCSVGDMTPKQMADYLAASDTGIQGLSPGVDTERFLAYRRQQLKLLNAAFIACVSLAARAVDIACFGLIAAAPSTLSILLLVSTVLGCSRQVEALTRGTKVERMIEAEYGLLERAQAQQGGMM